MFDWIGDLIDSVVGAIQLRMDWRSVAGTDLEHDDAMAIRNSIYGRC